MRGAVRLDRAKLNYWNQGNANQDDGDEDLERTRRRFVFVRLLPSQTRSREKCACIGTGFLLAPSILGQGYS